MKKKLRNKAKANRSKLIKRFTDYYDTVDAGKVELPSFIKAKNIVDEFRRQGVISETYEICA